MKRSRAVLAAVAIVVAVGAGVFAMRGSIAMAMMARAYDRAMGPDPIAALPAGLTEIRRTHRAARCGIHF